LPRRQQRGDHRRGTRRVTSQGLRPCYPPWRAPAPARYAVATTSTRIAFGPAYGQSCSHPWVCFDMAQAAKTRRSTVSSTALVDGLTADNRLPHRGRQYFRR
jgi:hypothetical protein